MAVTIQFRRGNTAQNDAFTGAVGELTYDTAAKKIRIHDGATAGGKTMATEEDVGVLVVDEVASVTPGLVETAVAALSAADLAFTPAGTIAANNVQAAIEELDADVQARQIADAAITPANLTANQNNYAPTGHATASVWFLTSDSTVRTITGLAGGAAGRKLTLYNANTTTPILLANDSGSSVAANRFDLGLSFVVIPAKTAVNLVYGGATARWRLSEAGSPTRRGAFAANKTANQSISANTLTDVSWVETLDDAGLFASNIWTPRAGPAYMSAAIAISGEAAGIMLGIYKNNSGSAPTKAVQTTSQSGLMCALQVDLFDVASGSDTYRVKVRSTQAGVISAQTTLGSVADACWFQGVSL